MTTWYGLPALGTSLDEPKRTVLIPSYGSHVHLAESGGADKTLCGIDMEPLVGWTSERINDSPGIVCCPQCCSIEISKMNSGDVLDAARFAYSGWNEEIALRMLRRIHDQTWVSGRENPVTMSEIDWAEDEQAVWRDVLDPSPRCPHCNARLRAEGETCRGCGRCEHGHRNPCEICDPYVFSRTAKTNYQGPDT